MWDYSYLSCEINVTYLMFDIDSCSDCGVVLQEYEYLLFRKVKICNLFQIFNFCKVGVF